LVRVKKGGKIPGRGGHAADKRKRKEEGGCGEKRAKV